MSVVISAGKTRPGHEARGIIRTKKARSSAGGTRLRVQTDNGTLLLVGLDHTCLAGRSGPSPLEYAVHSSWQSVAKARVTSAGASSLSPTVDAVAALRRHWEIGAGPATCADESS